MALFAIALALAACVAAALYLFTRNGNKTPSPIHLRDVRPPNQTILGDKKQRKNALKRPFDAEVATAEEWDAVIVGSGIGGLAVAALLAKSGWRVLVLEQHTVPGGCTHTYEKQGYEFDIGIHYIGNLNKGSFTRMVSDIITDGQLKWVETDKEFDEVLIGDPKSPKHYEITDFQNGFCEKLKAYFPKHADAIQTYCDSVKILNRSKTSMWLIAVKMLPLIVSKLMIKLGIADYLAPQFAMARKSTQDFVTELTDDKDLQTVLTYNHGDYGESPANSSWLMHSLLVGHYARGAFYPEGGATEIALNAVRTIEASGGVVMTHALVRLMLFDSTGRVNGVRVVKKKAGVETLVRAKRVISDAGIANTFLKLLPEHPMTTKSRYFSMLSEIGNSATVMQVFVGLNASTKELGLRARNYWCYPKNDMNCIREYSKLSREQALDVDPPMLFISFPSAKDPLWEQRHPGKAVCCIITLANFQWFREWERKPHAKLRSDEYTSVKKTIGERMWHMTTQYFPQLADKRDYMEIGSPTSHQYYIASAEGSIYGLAQNMARTEPENWCALRAQTDIPGLYLTGQDVVGCGYAGACSGAVLCASHLLNRNLFTEAMELAKTQRE